MKKIYFILAIAISTAVLPVSAQQLNSAYFTEGYKFRHHLNPAFASSRSYFSIATGNINVGVNSNMGISTFLYPTADGRLTTFMNGSVSADEFLSRLNRKNILGVDAGVSLISTGTWGKHGFTSVELNLKSSSAVNLPKDLFDFMKNVGQRQSYNFSNLGVRSRNYMELAIGHSHSITKRLNIGAKVKFLLGIASADVRVDDVKVDMYEDQWRVDANGSLYAAVPGLDLGTKAGGEIDFNDISIFEYDNDGSISSIISQAAKGLGYGAAIDLGASYEIIDGLTVSAALLDFGFLSWGNVVSAHTDNEPWTFDGFEKIAINDPESSTTIDKQIEAIGEAFKDFIVLYKDEQNGRRLEMLSATLNVGAEYKMPFYKRLSVGFLYSNRFSGPYSKYDGRFFVDIHPLKWFELSANYGISNHGSSFGATLSLDFPGIGIFLGTDNLFWDVTPPLMEGINIGVPYKRTNVSLNFGLTFNVSKLRHLGDRRD